MSAPSRVIVWFSCGAPSACAAKLALGRWPDAEVVYCDMSIDEHPDNRRFARDVSKWLGKEIISIHSSEYSSVDEVINKTRFFAGVNGARCTTELKKIPRRNYQQAEDLHIWGYTVEEFGRIVRFREQNPFERSYFILAGQGLTKDDCKRMVLNAGIDLPAMYQLGFVNNNCIGCGKAESVEYWQRVRHYFPEIFEKRCRQSREIGWRPLRLRVPIEGPTQPLRPEYKVSLPLGSRRVRAYLDQLPPVGPEELGEITEDISCGPVCGGQQ